MNTPKIDYAKEEILDTSFTPNDTGDFKDIIEGVLEDLFADEHYQKGEEELIESDIEAIGRAIHILEDTIMMHAIQETCTLRNMIAGNMIIALQGKIPHASNLSFELANRLIESPVKRFFINNPKRVERLAEEVDRHPLSTAKPILESKVTRVVQRLFAELCRDGTQKKIRQLLLPTMHQ